ncbi:tetratricopeptide repeat protein [Methylobacter sp. Wu8]|uniref:Ancillary SecYEG translocon subunit n=1 Tax=Methylobacter tundripaludum TaxID=173365 RepID=A0A2S6H4N6_9GAMM|nr:tetratricopeptide repeat protein [Methylobacter tundripaludum]MCK9635942.1 tetratricopeptide repeat protein [Methylobacter tundripaludum]PPK72380.1 putative negative regulator of RcsB-dependent stress response [Methylobacter tundripaludum]
MEIYDTEEEQVEALKRWWKENSTSTIVGLVMGIVIILGWNYWQDHKKERAAQASATYDQLLKALDDDKKDSADKLAERMQEQFKGTEYAAFSGLFQAKLKAQQGDVAAAKQILKTIAAESNKALGNIARIRLVRLMLATGEYEQGLQVINEVDAKQASSYSANYDELVGDLYVALDRLDEARTSYQNALREGQPSPLLQFKIDDLTAQEKLEAPK